MLESISKAIRVVACGHEGDYRANLQESKFDTLFSGVLNDTVIRDRLEEYLYSIVDVAQQTTAAEEGSRWLHTTGAELE